MPVAMKSVLVGVELRGGGSPGVLPAAQTRLYYGGVTGNFFDDEAKKSYYWPEPGARKALRMPAPMADFLIAQGWALEVTVAASAPADPDVGDLWYSTTDTRLYVRGSSAWGTPTDRLGVPAGATSLPLVASVATQK